jgi:hypothetical protein
MLLDGPCFLHDKFPRGVAVSQIGRNGTAKGRKFELQRKMYTGIEKGTETVE